MLSSTADDNKTPGLEEIVVTGTNISGVENKTVPLLTFDRDAIDRSGYATVADFITSLPQNVKSGSNSPDGVLAGTGFGLGNIENSTAANLRGLGANSTLTLLNGHRVAPSAYGSGVDLSMIPLEAVERIEVLTDGSSAVYGSDAVGGVINIILRKDFNGQETSARLDTLTQGGGELKQFSQTVGRTWDTGGALAVFNSKTPMRFGADQRSFTENLPQPTDIFPSSKRYSGVLTAHQTLSSLPRTIRRCLAGAQHAACAPTPWAAPTTQMQVITSHTNSTSANLGARWQPFGDWHLEGSGLYSQVDTQTTEIFTPNMLGYINGAPYLRNLETIKEGDLKFDGTLWSSGGSSVKAAVGASYRQEAFSSLVEFTGFDRATSRHIHAFFAELYAPLITSANALPGVQKLELSAAVRDDDYSDFGTKINPRFGVYLVAYRSDRTARSLQHLVPRAQSHRNSSPPCPTPMSIIESGFAQPGDPTGNSQRPAVRQSSLGSRELQEHHGRSRFSADLASRPPASRSITIESSTATASSASPFSANVFVNPQIYGPLIRQFPNDAAVEAFVAGLEPPQTVVDLSSGQTGLAGVRYAFPYGDINATKETH